MTAPWYWCLTHQQVEPAGQCRATDRMGPYDSPEAARDWKDRAEGREDAWKAEDERWDGDR